MPRRNESTQQKPEAGSHEYSYEHLLMHVRKHIDVVYGGVTDFMANEDFREAGFLDTPNERAKISTYLSLPPEGEKARVRSYPVLQVLYRYFWGIELESKVVVTRVQILHSDTKI